MGRPSKATEARIEALLAALRTGNTREAAAGHAEINRTTLYRWLERDAGLRARVDKAEADAEVRFEAQIAKASANGDWRSAAWWLEHRRAATYGRAAAMGVGVGSAATTAIPVAHPLDDLTAAERADRARAWADTLETEAVAAQRPVVDVSDAA